MNSDYNYKRSDSNTSDIGCKKELTKKASGELEFDIEDENGTIMIYGQPTDLNKIKEAILSVKEVTFDIDEIAMLPKDKIKLQCEDLEIFNKLITMLDEVDDTSHIYHNVDIEG